MKYISIEWCYLLFRYLSEIDLLTQHFTQLVGGVIWLLRDGETYIKESMEFECSDTEETGKHLTSYNVIFVVFGDKIFRK